MNTTTYVTQPLASPFVSSYPAEDWAVSEMEFAELTRPVPVKVEDRWDFEVEEGRDILTDDEARVMAYNIVDDTPAFHYVDCDNLYGKAMTEAVVSTDYRWVKRDRMTCCVTCGNDFPYIFSPPAECKDCYIAGSQDRKFKQWRN